MEVVTLWKTEVSIVQIFISALKSGRYSVLLGCDISISHSREFQVSVCLSTSHITVVTFWVNIKPGLNFSRYFYPLKVLKPTLRQFSQYCLYLDVLDVFLIWQLSTLVLILSSNLNSKEFLIKLRLSVMQKHNLSSHNVEALQQQHFTTPEALTSQMFAPVFK